MTEESKSDVPSRYNYRYLTADEVRARYIEELRKAESTHIANVVQGTLNHEKSKLMKSEAFAGGKQDNAKLKIADELKRKVLEMKRDQIAFERVVETIEQQLGDVLGTDEDVDSAIEALEAEERKRKAPRRTTTTVEEA